MSFPLSNDAQRLIVEKLRSGRYRTADEVVLAGLASLDQAEHFGDFAAGEWDALLQAGEQSLTTDKSVDAAEALNDLKARLGKPTR